MAYKELPPPDMMKRLVRINAKTGLMFWKPRKASDFAHCTDPVKYRDNWNKRYAGKQCFCTVYHKGHLGGKIYRINLFANRVAWCLYYGEWAQHSITHKNGDYADNRKANLVRGKDGWRDKELVCAATERIKKWLLD